MVSEIVEKIEAAAGVGGELVVSVNIPAADLLALAASWRRQREVIQGLLYEWNRLARLIPPIVAGENIQRAIKALED